MQNGSGVTQSRNEVKVRVCSNAGVLLCSGRNFDVAVYHEMMAALQPLTSKLTPSPESSPLNTVLIVPDADEPGRS